MLKFISRFAPNNLVNNFANQLPRILQRSIKMPLSTNLDNAIAEKEKITKLNCGSIFNNIRKALLKQDESRLFAIIHVCGKQFKITSGDIILVQGYWPPTIGDRLRLDKVLLAGSNDFTLVGRPILEPEVCDIQATIIEKTLSHTKTNFRKKRRKQYQRINFFRSPHTMIRINSININPNFNEKGNFESNNLKLF